MKSPLYYSILYKGLEHSGILVWLWLAAEGVDRCGSGTNPP